jgi:hypothetical protein
MRFGKYALSGALGFFFTVFSATVPVSIVAQQAPIAPPVATTVPLTQTQIVPTEFNGDVRDLPQLSVPDYYHLWNEPEEPDLHKTPPAPGPRGPSPGPNIALAPMPSPSTNFAGLGFSDSVTGGQVGAGWPPDTNGDVGPNHYIQAVNDAYGIYNKSGTQLAAFTENSLWSVAGTGTKCDANNFGDPVVLHDGIADRWILTNFAFSTSGGKPVTPFYQCIAVSKTSDPVSGGWYFYAVQVDIGGSGPPAGTLNDYGKFGLTANCLYMGANGFTEPAGSYAGAIFASFSRTALFAGTALSASNSSIGYLAADANGDPFGMFPANLLGTSAGSMPPAGTPEYFVNESATAFAWEVRKFTPGAGCGSGGTLSSATNVSQAVYGAPYILSGGSYTSNMVAQSGTTRLLDSLGDRIMQKVQYRKIGSAESLWVVHTTCGSAHDANFACANTTSATQPQWAQIDVTGSTINATPVQEQIYAPDTTMYRWMGSLAVDGQGDMALGYSTSNGTNFPSLAYSGRLVGDPLNNLSQTETQLAAGLGSQNLCGSSGCSRWGDYSSMSIDPSDDCTFWYTSEYYATAASATNGHWTTRIGSFKFPSCGKLSQTITFPNPGPVTYSSGGTFALGATASSGLTVTYTSTTTGVCTVSGSTVTIVTAGSCSINADQAGDATYNAAPTVTDAITISKASQTISFPNPGPVTYSSGGTFGLGATATSGLAVSYTSSTTGVCTVSSSTVTIVTAGTCTIKADQAGNTNYSAAPQVSDDITISKAAQAINFTSTAPAGATVGGSSYNVTATGGASGNAVTFTIDPSASSVCSIVGSTVSFTAVGTCVIDANQAGNTNYSAAPQQQQSFAVGKGSQTISFPNPGPVTYSSGGTFGLGATATSGLAVSYTSTTTGVCTVSSSTVTIVTAGTCTIKADQAGNSNYNAAPQVSDDITISKASQTISFPNPGPVTYSSGGTFGLGATATSGLGVTYTSTTTGVCTVSSSTVTIVTAGTCTIKADQAGNTNYNAAPQVSDDITISKASQTISFPNPGPVTYSSGGTFGLGATATSGLGVTYSSTTTGVCTVSASTVTIVTAGTCTIKADQAGNTNYSAAPQVSDDITISKASQTISFPNPGPVTYSSGGTFGLGATATSGLGVTYTSSTTSVCTVSASTVTIVTAGTCTIKADQAGNTNYSAAPQVGDDITISKASQTISFPNPGPVTYSSGGTFGLGATATSGLGVTYSSTTTGVCTVSGSTVSIVTAGTCTIIADQAGNTNYSAAPQVGDDITISKANQTISFPNPGPVTYSSGGTFGLGATATSGLGVTYSSTTSGVCTVSGSTVSIVTAGTCTIKADQAGNTNYNAASQVGDDITISKANQTISFSTSAPANAQAGGTGYAVAATTTSGLTVALAIDGSSTSVCAISGGNVSFIGGVGTCVIDANQAGDSNYNSASQQQQSFAVAAGTPTALVFVQQPTDSTAGVALNPSVTVQVQDAFSNVVTADSNTVDLAVTSGPGPFDLFSTTTVAFSNGVATYSNLLLDVAGTGYTLTANDSADGLTSLPSNSFAIAAAAPLLVFTTQPLGVTRGSALNAIAVTKQDSYGNVYADSDQVDFSVPACGGNYALGSVAMVSGVAVLPGTHRFFNMSASLQITANDGAASLSALSGAFAVTDTLTDFVFADSFDGCRP